MYLACFVSAIFTITVIKNIKYSHRKNGFLTGFTGGVLISFVSFEVIPVLEKIKNYKFSFVFIILALILIIYYEEIYMKRNEKFVLQNFYNMCVVSIIEKIFFGIGIGGILIIDFEHSLKLIIITSFHIFLEFLEFFYSQLKVKNNGKILFTYTISLITTFSLGVYLGEILVEYTSGFIVFFISFIISKIVFTSFGIMIPKSRVVWNGRMSILGVCIGYFFALYIGKYL